jgi:hypothetical protein
MRGRSSQQTIGHCSILCTMISLWCFRCGVLRKRLKYPLHDLQRRCTNHHFATYNNHQCQALGTLCVCSIVCGICGICGIVVLLFLVGLLVELPPPAAADFRSDSSILMFFLTSRHLDSVANSNLVDVSWIELSCIL